MSSPIAIPEGQTPKQVRAAHLASEKAARDAGLVSLIFAAFMMSGVITMPIVLKSRYEAPAVVIITALVFAIGVTYLLVGRGLRALKSWARPTAVLVSVPLLFAVPVGSIFGGLILYFVLKADRFVFSRTYQEVIAADSAEAEQEKA